MRTYKWTYRIVGALAVVGVVIYLDACKLGRFIFYNFSNITDHKIFPSRPLHAGEIRFRFPLANHPVVPNLTDLGIGRGYTDLAQFLQKTHTVAFLVIKDDSIHYENYFNGYNDSSIVASFSMAKSVTSLLIGIAIEEGLIGSEDDLLIRYLPEFEKNGMERVKLKHLLQMTSALNFDESYYNPLGEAASFYYGTRLVADAHKLRLKGNPGDYFEYNSGNTQLLGMVLEKVLRHKTITEYLQEKLWTPLQMEFDASWSIDKENEGIEKVFCCINARARDFAKIGRLLLQNGEWNGQQIISKDWISKIQGKDLSEGASATYQYQFWKGDLRSDYMAQGHLGQFIYINPDKQLLIIRLGEDKGNVDWKTIFTNISNFY